MRPRRAALSSRRGTLCFWPATVTPTSSGLAAFHCARRPRVFARDILEAGGNDSWENLADAAPVLLARGDQTVLVVTDPFHEARSLAIASSVGLQPYPTPTQTSPIKGFSTVPYYAKETVGVALGRIIGFENLDSIHPSFG